MSPRSPSRSITPRRSYSRSPNGRNKRRRRKYDSRSSSSSRHPLSPPPIKPKSYSGRYSNDNKNVSRSISPSSKKRYNNRRHHSRSHSKSKTRSRSRSRSLYDKSTRNSREKPLPCRCIGVFGLSVYTTQQKIREIFSKFGPIERIQVVIDAQTGRSRGFCFIYYENLSDARDACDNCCGMEIDGRRIRVAYSITERPHTPTPGVYMGKSAKALRERYRAQQQRHHSPVTYKSRRSSRHRYERSRSRSYSPRRCRY